jgi:hypothetical protein
VDQSLVVPVGYDGDEQWVLSFTTTAYSNNTSRTAIQDIYVQEMKAGWYKSSGMVNLSGYQTSATSKILGVKMDASSGFYYVTLSEGLVGGDDIADALEAAIREIPNASGTWSTSDDSLAYKNAVVSYDNNKFYIVSGSFSRYYTGSLRSSVVVASGVSDTMYTDLGFNLGVGSESIAGTAIIEAYLTGQYTAGGATLGVSTTSITSGTVAMITDGVNSDYFPILNVAGATLTVPTVASNGFNGITHNYAANVTKVQVLKYQDPNQVPVPYHDTVDSVVRWGISSLANQIDFSS